MAASPSIYAGGMPIAESDKAIIAGMRGTATPAASPLSQINSALGQPTVAAAPAATSVAPVSQQSLAMAAPAAPTTSSVNGASGSQAPTAAPAPAPAPTPYGGVTVTGYQPPPPVPPPSSLTPQTTTPAQPPAQANVANWYRSVLGRDADQAGLDAWNARLAGGANASDVYQDFRNAAMGNGEIIHSAPSSYEQANSYSGPTSGNGRSTVDDWGTNVLGRQLSPAEQQKYDQMIAANPTVAGTQAAYAQFLADNAGQVKNNMDVFAASQLKAAPASPLTINGPQESHGYDPTLLDDPTKWDVTADQTVQGQLTGIMDQNSPIIQQARTQALQQMEGRGLTNSSLAVTAGQDAAYRAATPIAGADASTYSKAAGYNADQKNQFAVKNADISNTSKQFNADAANKWDMANLDANTRMNMQFVDSQTKTDLANIEANYKMLIQSNTSAGDEFRQASANITNIAMSKDMDASAKQIATNNQLQLLQTSMQINGAISNLNLGSLLNFSGMQAQTGFVPGQALAYQGASGSVNGASGDGYGASGFGATPASTGLGGIGG